MKRLALFAATSLMFGCQAHAYVRAPAPVVVVDAPPVTVVATTDTAPPAPPPAEPVVATASVDVEASGDIAVDSPVEVTATTEPPEPIYEEPLDTPGPAYVWVGGYWGWTGSEWGWNGGRWSMAPAGRVYIEPYYEHVNGRVVYVGGYWGARGAERPYYGGTRIVYAAPARPVGYVRGQRPVVVRAAGVAPGSRPASFYQRPAAGVVARPLPTATVPPRAMAGGGSARTTGVHPDSGPAYAPHESPHREPTHPASPPHEVAPTPHEAPREVHHEPTHPAAPPHEATRPAQTEERRAPTPPPAPKPKPAPTPPKKKP